MSGEHDTDGSVSRVISVTSQDIGPSTGGSQDRSGDSEGGAGAGADLSLMLMV